MKRSLFAFSLLACAGLCWSQAKAGDIRHTFAGDNTNSFYVDDAGGSINNGGHDLSYYLNLHDVDQSAIGTLFVYGNDGINTRVDNGYADQDFSNGSGIQLFDLSVLPGTNLPGEIGLAKDSPLTPVSYDADQTGLSVQQVSYTSATPGDQFVIVEYRVVNQSSGPVTARLALSNDFDVDLKSSDARVGFDNSTGIPLVFQQEAPPLDPTYTTVGVGLIRGQLAQYRLEVCNGAFGSCQILDGNDAVRTDFFNGVDGAVGDLTQGVPNQDFASTIAANLGTLQPGKGQSAVFCYHLANGDSPGNGLANCTQAAQNCESFYDTQIDICGNGLTNFGEDCDDGNNDVTDACPSGPSGTCQPAFCGDGFLHVGVEGCDDGNAATNDSCPSGPSGTCQAAACGDGFLWNTDGGTETCDDGNNITTDACPSGPSGSCQAARCGDGFIQQGVEVCDDGNNDVTDACPSGPSGTCQPATCGDGFIEQGVEGCDDGNAITDDACPSGPSGSCQLAFCGDGFVRQGVEVCDTAISGGNCVNNCTSFDSCGNGNLDPGEQCDDGNANTSDGCPSGPSGTCQNAHCGDGYLEVGVEGCDDGNNTSGDGCDSTCHSENGVVPNGPPPVPPVCGNGIREGNEECDDGNQSEKDTCSNQCLFLPTLQGGGTSANSPRSLDVGGCSLQSAGTNSPGTSVIGGGLLALGMLAWSRRRMGSKVKS